MEGIRGAAERLSRKQVQKKVAYQSPDLTCSKFRFQGSKLATLNH